jgi:uncharacterized protein (TIGR02145 family)
VANDQVYFLNNGQFNFLACGNSISMTPYTTPVWANGQAQTFVLSGSSLNVGNLQVCNGANTGTVTDIDGHIYQTVQIGTQTWMAENLRTTKYRNGDPIPNVTDGNQWSNLTPGAWAHYNNGSQYENPYGKLYKWYAGADPRNVCPTGWHVPTDAEWKVLTDYLGGESVAGGKMKSTGTQYWQSPNQDATNESGFSGLPGGYRGEDGTFGNVGYAGHWWSSTDSSGYAWYRYLGVGSGVVTRVYSNKREGFSVRCVRD